MSIQKSLETAVEHHRQNRPDDAEAIGRQILAEHPDHAATFYLSLSKALQMLGRRDEMIASLRRAIELDPNLYEAKFNLASALLNSDKAAEAAAIFREMVSIDPNFTPAWNNLGLANRAMGRTDEAKECFRRALEINGDFADARFNLANLHMDQGRWSEAIDGFRRAIAAKPDLAEAHNNLAAALGERGMLEEAMTVAQKAIALRPEYGKAYNNYANILKQAGLFTQAFGPLQKAKDLMPGDATAHGAFIHAMLYRPEIGAGEILQEEKRWDKLHGKPLASLIQPHPNDRNPDRKLRIGYVSADFCDHIAGLNLLPLLRNHDHRAFEVFCYSNNKAPDRLTELFKSAANKWREIRKVDDDAAARLIREDRIDILMDLSLHSAGNRLQLFARKPAPLQGTFIGYPGSTGLSAIDFRLTDPHLDPPGRGDEFYTEESIRLDNSFWCYDPVAMQVGDYPVAPLPALSNGIVTFGSLNNLLKLNDSVLELWAKVLHAIPKSRLMIVQVNEWVRPWILQKLQTEGIDAARVECVPRLKRLEYFNCFGRIDICLDAFPYNGHTTSLDAFWMGVPTVTLIGSTVVGRAGFSQLCNLGLKELAASTPEEYVKIVTDLSGDLPHLAEIRRGLRERMRKSPLCDAAGFARSVEKAYRRRWTLYCSTGKK